MSMITVSSLPRVSREKLSSWLLERNGGVAVVDVRDDDHIGGHILHSLHVPSSTLDHRMPELVRTLRDRPAVVFHCALSQQRGPAAGLSYLRERERLTGTTEHPDQQVYVLDGGFTKWQEKYGSDQRLTEGWVKDIWENHD